MIYTTNVQVSRLIEISDICKLLKCDIVYVTEFGQVFGTDIGFTFLQTINRTVSVLQDTPLILKAIDLRNYLKINIYKDTYEMAFPSQFCVRNEPNEVECLLFYKAKFDSIIKYMNDIENTIIPSYVQDSIHLDMDFRKMLKSKIDIGASLLIRDNYAMYLIKSIMPINSADRVHLEIYKYEDSFFIAKFAINKGNTVICHYIKFLSLK